MRARGRVCAGACMWVCVRIGARGRVRAWVCFLVVLAGVQYVEE